MEMIQCEDSDKQLSGDIAQSSEALIRLEDKLSDSSIKEKRSYLAISKLLDEKAKRNGKATYSIKPSPVMEKIKAFMPKLKEAQTELNGKISKGEGDMYNIEKICEEDNSVIEMNLSLLSQCNESSDSSESESDCEYENVASSSSQSDSTNQSEENSSKKFKKIEMLNERMT